MLGGCDALGLGNRRAAPSAGLAAANRSDPALSGDGRLLASLIEQDGRLRIWNVAAGTVLHTLEPSAVPAPAQ
jgi:hypothetical protein